MPEDIRPMTEIDLTDLPGECARHSKLLGDINDLIPDAKLRVADLEAEMKVLKAETLLLLRNDPEKYGLGLKPAADLIKGAVDAQPAILELQKRINRRQHRVDVLIGAAQTRASNKGMIEKAVELLIGGFFAEPKVPAKYREEVGDRKAVEARRRAVRRK
jgi:hypothetical protein